MSYSAELKIVLVCNGVEYKLSHLAPHYFIPRDEIPGSIKRGLLQTFVDGKLSVSRRISFSGLYRGRVLYTDLDADSR